MQLVEQFNARKLLSDLLGFPAQNRIANRIANALQGSYATTTPLANMGRSWAEQTVLNIVDSSEKYKAYYNLLARTIN